MSEDEKKWRESMREWRRARERVEAGEASPALEVIAKARAMASANRMLEQAA